MDSHISNEARLPRFRSHLKRVHGRIGEVCSDSANSCRENASLFASMGGRPFLVPRKNASSKAIGHHQAWKGKMLFRERHPQRFEREKVPQEVQRGVDQLAL